MNKQVRHGFGGMNQDISKYNYPENVYYEANNIRIVSANNQSTLSIINEKGNAKSLSIPTPVIDSVNKKITFLENDDFVNYNYNPNIAEPRCELEEDYFISTGVYKTSDPQEIIGHTITQDYLVLLTTDNYGFDCIWKFDTINNTIKLLYLRNLEWSKNNPIQVLNNFENDIINKIYWVDAKHQLRFINIEHSITNGDLEEIIDIPKTRINSIGKYNLSQPIIENIISGGNHTAGMIMYAYNLYTLQGAQTGLSPVSNLISLDKGEGNGGGDVNEQVGNMPYIKISNIDPNYSNIKIYAIKYTSFGELPSVSLIKDVEVPSTKELSVLDDGDIISSLSVEELLFLNADIIIPKHIETKDNSLFCADFTEKTFKLDLDFRAYSFDNVPVATVYKDIELSGGNVTGTPTNISTVDYDLDLKHDAINLDYDLFRYQSDGVTEGGEGKYIKYELITPPIEEQKQNNRYFKDEELYRLGIQFYNKYGQISFPSWIADFKAPSGNLENNPNALRVELKPEFFVWLNTNVFDTEYDIPIGFKILLAERNMEDHTIVTSGILSTMMFGDKSKDDWINEKADKKSKFAENNPKVPNILLRNCNNNNEYIFTKPLRGAVHLAEMNQARIGHYDSYNSELRRNFYTGTDIYYRGFQYNNMLQLYSPETIFNEKIPLSSGLQLKIKGAYRNTFNAGWDRNYYENKADNFEECKFYGGLSTYYNLSADGKKDLMSGGIVGARVLSETKNTQRISYLRQYGVNSELLKEFSKNKIVNFEGATITFTESSAPDPIPPAATYPISTDEETFIPGEDKFRFITSSEIDDTLELRLQATTDSDESFYTSVTITPAELTKIYTIEIRDAITGENMLLNPENYQNIIGIQTLTTKTTNISPILSSEQIFNLQIRVYSDEPQTFSIDTTSRITSTLGAYREWEVLNHPFEITELNDNIDFIPVSNIIYDIYGAPELTEKGQDFKNYNNDGRFRYSNSLKSVGADGNTYKKLDSTGPYGNKIISVNSYNNRCITLVLPIDDNKTSPQSEDHNIRVQLEDILTATGIVGDKIAFIGELVKSKEEIYLGNIYGGNSYEDKLRTRYFEIGDYKQIDSLSPILNIYSPGDTYVQLFNFERIYKAEEEHYDTGYVTLSEIISYPSESKINLINRNDISNNDWDTRFQPSFDEYHKYNKVYSQKSELFLRKNTDYTFKPTNSFRTDIIASKTKVSGEIIDSWTDLLQNERMTLDGKYGPINALVKFNDNMYAFQDNATAFISVNPTTQVQGGDGITVELGKGTLLHDYKYLSTEYGTLNKWSVINTPTGIYSFDAVNKSLNKTTDHVESLSTKKNMRTFFHNNTYKSLLSEDNPLIKKGVSVGYDYINNDVLMTFLQEGKNPFTIAYNENFDTFTSFYDYNSSKYISKGDFLYSLDASNNQLWKAFEGDYNRYYESDPSPSNITFLVNPEKKDTITLNNVSFLSEVYEGTTDKPEETLTHVKVWNEYQESDLTPLVLGRDKNLRRRFREWDIILPREKDTRNRIKNPWNYLKLEFQNNNNYKMILHPPIISYNV